MRYYRVGEAAKQMRVSASTLRNYTRAGRITAELNPAGQRVYSQDEIDRFLGVVDTSGHDMVFYVRSSDGDQVKMDTQVRLLTEKFGEPAKIYKDRASGLNEKRPGLVALMNAARKGRISLVCVTEKDRLTRFGWTYLENFFELCDVKIVVLGEKIQKTAHEELVQDFLSLLASFSGKYYRLRGHRQSKDFLEKISAEHG